MSNGRNREDARELATATLSRIGNRGCGMGRPDFEDLEVYRLAEKLAKEIWHIVKERDSFAIDELSPKLNAYLK